MAEEVELLLREGKVEEQRPIERRREEERAPLSHAQQRLWFMEQMEPGNAGYNISAGLKMIGRVDVEVMERTLNEIIRRHEVLRTRFMEEAGEPIQVIDEWEQLKLQVEDLSYLEKDRMQGAARGIFREELRKPFDLSKGPLLHVRLLRLEEEEHIILFTMHHIISDGWSLGVLIDEVTAMYEAFSGGKESPLNELPIQYADYAAWQKEQLQREWLNEQLNYWKHQLEGAPELLNLSIERERPQTHSYRGAEQRIEIDDTLAKELKLMSRQEDVTLFMTLLAAFKVLLRHMSQTRDIVVGTDVANRNRVETEKLIGLFVNQLVLRTQVNDHESFQQLLNRIRGITIEAYAHQDIPFDLLVKALRPERNLKYMPLFQVMFGFQNAPMPPLNLSDLEISPFEVEIETSVFDLSLYMTEIEGSVIGSLRYNTLLFEADAITDMLSNFEMILRHVVLHRGCSIREIIDRLEDRRQQQRAAMRQGFKELSRQKLKGITPKATAT
jgi:NRPS condensation-like uncharacterized protein